MEDIDFEQLEEYLSFAEMSLDLAEYYLCQGIPAEDLLLEAEMFLEDAEFLLNKYD